MIDNKTDIVLHILLVEMLTHVKKINSYDLEYMREKLKKGLATREIVSAVPDGDMFIVQMGNYIKKVTPLEFELHSLASVHGCAPNIVSGIPDGDMFRIETEAWPNTISDLLESNHPLVKEYLVKAKDVLTKLHSTGILHRDISEDNIACNTETGEVRFIDFGMSRKISSIEEVDVEYYQDLYSEGVKFAGDPEPTVDYVLRLEHGCIQFLINCCK